MRRALDSPALVVGQVQVEQVELQVGELADVRVDPRGRVDAAAEIDHQAALGVTRPVERPAAGNREALVEELKQRAAAVEDAGGRSRADVQGAPGDEAVALPTQPPVASPEQQADVAAAQPTAAA